MNDNKKNHGPSKKVYLSALLFLASTLSTIEHTVEAAASNVICYQLPKVGGSTHELSFSPDVHAPKSATVWITQQNSSTALLINIKNNKVAVDANNNAIVTTLTLPTNSTPHGIVALSDTEAWVTLEGLAGLTPLYPNALAHIVLDNTQPLNYRFSQQITLDPGTFPHGLDYDSISQRLYFGGKGGTGVNNTGGSIGAVQTNSPSGQPVLLGQVSPTTNALTPSLVGKVIYTHITKGGKFVWFSDLGGSQLIRYDSSSNEIVKIQLPLTTEKTSANPISVSTDDSGAVWVVEAALNSIGYIPGAVAKGSGEILTSYPIKQIPIPFSNPTPGGGALAFNGMFFTGCGSTSTDCLIAIKNSASKAIAVPFETIGSVWHRTYYDTTNNMLWWTDNASDQFCSFNPSL